MITSNELRLFGIITSFYKRTGELVCRKTSSIWEKNGGTFIIFNIDNIFIPWRVLDWYEKGTDRLIFQLPYINDPIPVQNLLNREVYMFIKDIKSTLNEPSDLDFEHYTGYILHDDIQGELGQIAAVDTSTINKLVKLDTGQILPISEQFIVSVDNPSRKITVHLPFDVSSLKN